MLVDELGDDWRRDNKCFDIILLLSRSTEILFKHINILLLLLPILFFFNHKLNNVSQ